MSLFYLCTTVVLTLLLVLTLHAMLSGPWRRFPLLFTYVVLSLGLSAPLAVTYLTSGGRWSRTANIAYWVVALTTQAVLCAIVVHLSRSASGTRPIRGPLTRLMIGATAVVVTTSVLLHRPEKIIRIFDLNMWLTMISRDVSFLTAAMNLILWSLLLSIRKRDPLLVFISIGVGLQSAGDALGHALRYFVTGREVGNVVISIAALAIAFTLYSAFRRRPHVLAPTHSTNS